MKKTALIIAASLAAIAAPASAQTTGTPTTITLSVEVYDLTDAQDVAELENRAATAIRRACRSGGFDMAARDAESACRADLEAKVESNIDRAVADASASFAHRTVFAPEG